MNYEAIIYIAIFIFFIFLSSILISYLNKYLFKYKSFIYKNQNHYIKSLDLLLKESEYVMSSVNDIDKNSLDFDDKKCLSDIMEELNIFNTNIDKMKKEIQSNPKLLKKSKYRYNLVSGIYNQNLLQHKSKIRFIIKKQNNKRKMS